MVDYDNTTVQGLLAAVTAELDAVSASAALDAEVLLCHCLSKSRSFLRAWPEQQPNSEQIARFRALVEQRRQGHPIAYLVGEREFWSRTFKVSSDVLIPRPDTELLIELSLNFLADGQPSKIIDLGTGSGIIAITLAAERQQADVLATDLSMAALAVARDNAETLDIKNIRFLNSHWFDNINETGFDLVVSNPPYIAEHDPHLLSGDVRFEPDSALISAENGLRDIRLIAEQARHHLKIEGKLMIEHGYNQLSEVQAIFRTLNYRQVTTHADLSGNPRVTTGLWNPL